MEESEQKCGDAGDAIVAGRGGAPAADRWRSAIQIKINEKRYYLLEKRYYLLEKRYYLL